MRLVDRRRICKTSCNTVWIICLETAQLPIPQPPLAPELLGLVQHVASYERLAAAAAIAGDRTLVHKALLAHPLIGQVPQADELVDLLLTSGAEYLPQFQGKALA